MEQVSVIIASLFLFHLHFQNTLPAYLIASFLAGNDHCSGFNSRATHHFLQALSTAEASLSPPLCDTVTRAHLVC